VGVASSGRNGLNDYCQMISRTNNATIAAKTANPIHGERHQASCLPLYLRIICRIGSRSQFIES
jgi:hypothetical protein